MVMKTELKKKFLIMYLEEKSKLDGGGTVLEEQVNDLFTELRKFELVGIG